MIATHDDGRNGKVKKRKEKMASTKTLKTLVFMGSARNVVAPWGGEKRLGDRVLKYVLNTLKARENTLGNDETKEKVVVKHDFTVIDPLVEFSSGGMFLQIFK